MLSRYMSSDSPPWLFQPLASMTAVEPVKDVKKQPTSPTRMMMIFCFLIFIDLQEASLLQTHLLQVVPINQISHH